MTGIGRKSQPHNSKHTLVATLVFNCRDAALQLVYNYTQHHVLAGPYVVPKVAAPGQWPLRVVQAASPGSATPFRPAAPAHPSQKPLQGRSGGAANFITNMPSFDQRATGGYGFQTLFPAAIRHLVNKADRAKALSCYSEFDNIDLILRI